MISLWSGSTSQSWSAAPAFHVQSSEDSRKQEAIAAFYAGGVLNCYFRLMQEDATVDEALFFDVIKQMTKQMLY